jgi:hypothetical protein
MTRSGSSRSAACCPSTGSRSPRGRTTRTRVRSPSARAVRDAVVLARIEQVHADPQIGRGLYGVRKVHAQLIREGGARDGRSPVGRSSGSCAERDCGAPAAVGGSSRPSPMRAGLDRRTWCSGTSPLRRRTGCGWWTSPTCRPGPGWRSPRSSPTPTPAGSWAGAPLPACLPRCRWTLWRWPCGPANAQVMPLKDGWTASFNTATPGRNADSTGRRNTSMMEVFLDGRADGRTQAEGC